MKQLDEAFALGNQNAQQVTLLLCRTLPDTSYCRNTLRHQSSKTTDFHHKENYPSDDTKTELQAFLPQQKMMQPRHSKH